MSGLHIMIVVPVIPLPDHYVAGFMTAKSVTGNCSDERIEQLSGEALQAADAAASKPIYDELNKLGVVELNCYVPLYKQDYSYATKAGLAGVTHSALNVYDFSQGHLGK